MSLRRALRSPLAFWALVVVLALLTGGSVSRFVDQARAQAARYGKPRAVVVAVRGVELGDSVDDDDVALRQLPSALVPEDALGSPSAVVGRTVVVPLFPGQAVLPAHLAPSGLRGLAALLPPGTRAVGVPTGAASAPLRRGDRVDLIATLQGPAAEEGEPVVPVATRALVVDVGEESATVAVTPEEAGRVAFALAHGSLTLAVTAPVGG